MEGAADASAQGMQYLVSNRIAGPLRPTCAVRTAPLDAGRGGLQKHARGSSSSFQTHSLGHFGDQHAHAPAGFAPASAPAPALTPKLMDIQARKPACAACKSDCEPLSPFRLVLTCDPLPECALMPFWILSFPSDSALQQLGPVGIIRSIATQPEDEDS